MKSVLALVLFFLSVIASAQSDKPMQLTCTNAQAARAEVRSVKEGNPNTLVTTPVNTVGEHIPNLAANDFIIAKGKKRADILGVREIKATESTVMRVVFMIDNSQSMSEHLSLLTATLERVIRQFSGAVRVSVLFFNENVSGSSPTFRFEGKGLPIVRLPYTNDKERAITYIKRMLVEPNLSRSTYLYDGVYATLEQIKADTGKVDRSFAIVFSDGQDNASIVKAATDERADKLNTTFYTIDYRVKANPFLVSLAAQSSGEHFVATNTSELSKSFDEIANKIVAKGYEIDYRFKPLPNAALETPTNELVMDEEIIRETFPLLNYIFFDQGSAVLPSRYTHVTADRVAAFDESSIEGGALDFYYSILNILGQRMKAHPDAVLTLTGCIDNEAMEKNNTSLARDRALAVRSYLMTMWGIQEHRISVVASKLPSVASTSREEGGRAENRRVEITSDTWEILKPVTFVRRIATLQPPSIAFSMRHDAAEGLERATLVIDQSGKTFISRSGESLESSWTWDWKNEQGELPNSRDEIVATLSILDRAGDSFTTPKRTIAVREVKRERLKNVELDEGITKEKISLILFEFDKAEMGTRNERIMQDYVYTRMKNLRAVTVSGFTDDIGLDEYNLKLSERRADAVYQQLLTAKSELLTPENTREVGFGETQPNFPNVLPEGRFYNRTVSILIEK